MSADGVMGSLCMRKATESAYLHVPTPIIAASPDRYQSQFSQNVDRKTSQQQKNTAHSQRAGRSARLTRSELSAVVEDEEGRLNQTLPVPFTA